VVNRTEQRRAEAVRIGNTVRSGSTSEINANDIARFPTLINTTPVGMRGVHPGESVAAMPVEAAMLRAGQFVLDAVYHPLETALLRAVRDHGGVAIDGLEMLCAQAARQQELWLGRRPDVALMRTAALAELATSQQ
jgi:shikimate dehydrogenase